MRLVREARVCTKRDVGQVKVLASRLLSTSMFAVLNEDLAVEGHARGKLCSRVPLDGRRAVDLMILRISGVQKSLCFFRTLA
jgi:hypothetical protein